MSHRIPRRCPTQPLTSHTDPEAFLVLTGLLCRVLCQVLLLSQQKTVVVILKNKDLKGCTGISQQNYVPSRFYRSLICLPHVLAHVLATEVEKFSRI